MLDRANVPTRCYFPSMLSQQFKPALDELAHSGICIGTSSCKYPGWCGQIYDEQRYLTRGKFSEAKFERECLAEYAQTFSTVCVDAGYYGLYSNKRRGMHRSVHFPR